MNTLVAVVVVVVAVVVILILRANKRTTVTKVDVVWSKGYPLFFETGTNDYIFSSTEKPVSKNDIIQQQGNRYVWVKMGSSRVSENLKTFVDSMHLFTYPFILITTDGDSSIPLDVHHSVLSAILKNTNLVTWYTQNISSNEYSKIRPIPIGLDLHTTRTAPSKQLEVLYTIRHSQKEKEKKMKIFCDVHLNKNSKFNNPRQEVENLKYPTIEYLKSRIPRTDLWKEYANHAFVISTHGNGLDCHRTWEILLLGSIVITKTSSIDELFVNLPVVIVKDWSELRDPANLKIWYDRFTLTNHTS